jgi:hypothetical protein
VVPRAARGRLYVDKLVQVWRKDGRDAWVLIHVEVQPQRDPKLAKRLYGYNTRIAHRYNRTVVTFAVLADDDSNWRPDHYEDELWGWSVRMTWPPVKLLEYVNRAAELEQGQNPFARVVLAYLKALETRQDAAGRRAWKFRLVRGLYERGFSKEDVRQLYRMIDWLMELPPPLQEEFEQELDQYQGEQRMPFTTGFERRAMRRLIEDLLRTKFGEEGLELMPATTELNDAEKYVVLNRTIATATTLDQVRRACARAAAPARRRKKGGNGTGSSSKTERT